MAKMNQKGTDYGTKGESGEREPKGAKSSDTNGERKEPTKGGVGMGMRDKTGVAEHGVGRPAHHMGKNDGKLGEMNDGNMGERTVYEHKRVKHEQDE